MTDESDGDMSWDHLTQQEINNQKQNRQILNQPRSTLEILMSQAQEDSSESQTSRQKTSMNRKRTKSQNSQSDTSDSDTNTDYGRQQKRRNLNTYATQCNPTIVIINSPDVKLAQINPIEIAKALNSIGQNIIKNVSKTTQGGISVKCHTSGLANKTEGHLPVRTMVCYYGICKI